jgi:1-deoxy-D-xylulose-5-phosphate reductoisomerase
VLLTASGGPFRTAPLERLDRVTPGRSVRASELGDGPQDLGRLGDDDEQGTRSDRGALAVRLPPERIEVLIHPQSIVHSLVEYVDGSVIAQLSNPDMRVPIAHALAYPERIESGVRPLELGAVAPLSFQDPRPGRFPCLVSRTRRCAPAAGAPAVLNAANEIAVEAFLGGTLRFTAIAHVIDETLQRVSGGSGRNARGAARCRPARAARGCRLRGRIDRATRHEPAAHDRRIRRSRSAS